MGNKSDLARGCAAGLVGLAVYFFAFFVMFGTIFYLVFEDETPEYMLSVAAIASLVAAGAVSRWMWRTLGTADQGILVTTLNWAMFVGALGFCVGFIGPLIFMPEANLGPLIGFFVTGPLGFVVGGLLGLAYALWRKFATAD